MTVVQPDGPGKCVSVRAADTLTVTAFVSAACAGAAVSTGTPAITPKASAAALTAVTARRSADAVARPPANRRTLDRPRGPLGTEVLEALVIELTRCPARGRVPASDSHPCLRAPPAGARNAPWHRVRAVPWREVGSILSRSRTRVVRARSAQRHDPVIPGLRHRHPPLTETSGHRHPAVMNRGCRMRRQAVGGCGFTASSSRLLAAARRPRARCMPAPRPGDRRLLHLRPWPMIATATRIVSDRGAPSRRFRIAVGRRLTSGRPDDVPAVPAHHADRCRPQGDPRHGHGSALHSKRTPGGGFSTL